MFECRFWHDTYVKTGVFARDALISAVSIQNAKAQLMMSTTTTLCSDLTTELLAR
jgi:hypothetical protein